MSKKPIFNFVLSKLYIGNNSDLLQAKEFNEIDVTGLELNTTIMKKLTVNCALEILEWFLDYNITGSFTEPPVFTSVDLEDLKKDIISENNGYYFRIKRDFKNINSYNNILSAVDRDTSVTNIKNGHTLYIHDKLMVHNNCLYLPELVAVEYVPHKDPKLGYICDVEKNSNVFTIKVNILYINHLQLK
ncbi:MAG TPA: hypothetical protein PKD00_01505 [Burkholderiales bacterium]|nr:hypothetical protein [Burkholderiales bacterium]